MTGRAAVPYARTGLEAQVYLTTFGACRVCGEVTLDIRGARGGQIVTSCTTCRDEDAHEFRLPPRWAEPAAGKTMFGGPEPSELLDPGAWLVLADVLVAEVREDDLDELPAGLWLEYRNLVESAVAAVEEAMRFLVEGADTIPEESFWSEEGWALYQRAPLVVRRDRLTARRHAYRELLARYQQLDPDRVTS